MSEKPSANKCKTVSSTSATSRFFQNAFTSISLSKYNYPRADSPQSLSMITMGDCGESAIYFMDIVMAAVLDIIVYTGTSTDSSPEARLSGTRNKNRGRLLFLPPKCQKYKTSQPHSDIITTIKWIFASCDHIAVSLIVVILSDCRYHHIIALISIKIIPNDGSCWDIVSSADNIRYT